jgi:transcriptional regulator GlxA family with amidase domain
MINIAFFIPPAFQILDLAGPMQSFYCANTLGANYNLIYFSINKEQSSDQNLDVKNLQIFKDIKLLKGDYLFIPGIDGTLLNKDNLSKLGLNFYKWLKTQNDKGVFICSVCNAAFILAYSGLLDNKSCTTHWERFKQLQNEYPQINVLDNRLFVKDGNIYSSAGISSGIDLALDIIRENQGALFTAKVAKEMVIYIRRDSEFKQISVFLDYRNHINDKVHTVQDFIIRNYLEPISIQQLSDICFISPRHLSRIFKLETGITIKDFVTKIKLEFASGVDQNNNLNKSEKARKSGFNSNQQYQRALIKHN